MCVQCVNLSDPTSGVKGQEDCLYLNVFSPNVSILLVFIKYGMHNAKVMYLCEGVRSEP